MGVFRDRRGRAILSPVSTDRRKRGGQPPLREGIAIDNCTLPAVLRAQREELADLAAWVASADGSDVVAADRGGRERVPAAGLVVRGPGGGAAAAVPLRWGDPARPGYPSRDPPDPVEGACGPRWGAEHVPRVASVSA